MGLTVVSFTINEIKQALPVLENALGERNEVFADFLYRYALLLASEKDLVSVAKAEDLMNRANLIRKEPQTGFDSTK